MPHLSSQIISVADIGKGLHYYPLTINQLDSMEQLLLDTYIEGYLRPESPIGTHFVEDANPNSSVEIGKAIERILLGEASREDFYNYNQYLWFWPVTRLAMTLKKYDIIHVSTYGREEVTVGAGQCQTIIIESAPDGLYVNKNLNSVPIEIKYGYEHQDPANYNLQVLKHMFLHNSRTCLVISVNHYGDIRIIKYGYKY